MKFNKGEGNTSMNLKVGQTYDVTVVKILGFGAIVALEDGSTELIHISNISESYVADVSDFVDVDHTYSAMCIAGNMKPEELSLKHLNLVSRSRKSNGAEYGQRKFRRKNSSADHESTKSDSNSLEDMIAKSNSQLEDKVGRIRRNDDTFIGSKRNKRRR